MKLDFYEYRKATCIKGSHDTYLQNHIYSFKTSKKKSYIVNVEEYLHDVFILKFHTKATTWSKKKYTLLTNDHEARKIIFTCIQIGLEIYNSKPTASFGFIGAPTKNEIKRKHILEKTKRFRVYRKFATFFFSPNNFLHSANERYSSYLLINRQKINHDPDITNKIIDHFTELYDNPELYFTS